MNKKLIKEENIKEANEFINETAKGKRWLTIDDAEKLWIQGVDKLFKKNKK